MYVSGGEWVSECGLNEMALVQQEGVSISPLLPSRAVVVVVVVVVLCVL